MKSTKTGPLGAIRRLLDRTPRVVVAAVAIGIVEIGGRIALPGLNGQVVHDFFVHGGGGMLWLYDRLVGGAIARGAILALGVVPYISALIWTRIGRRFIPSIRKLESTATGHAKVARGTRVLTVCLALAQSCGLALFVQQIPGAVARPGLGFVVQTMLTLTAGAIVAMTLAERILFRRVVHEDDVAPSEPAPAPARQPANASEALPAGEAVPMLGAGTLDPIVQYQAPREKVRE